MKFSQRIVLAGQLRDVIMQGVRLELLIAQANISHHRIVAASLEALLAGEAGRERAKRLQIAANNAAYRVERRRGRLEGMLHRYRHILRDLQP